MCKYYLGQYPFKEKYRSLYYTSHYGRIFFVDIVVQLLYRFVTDTPDAVVGEFFVYLVEYPIDTPYRIELCQIYQSTVAILTYGIEVE
jgi:hypothetical protein